MADYTSKEWENIPGYNGKYQVSRSGLVRRVHPDGTVTPVKGQIQNKGYVRIELRINSRRNVHLMHRLVMLTFKGESSEGMQVNHKNGVKTDNRFDNLEYVTPSENLYHAIDTLRSFPVGVNAYGAKMDNDKIRQIRKLYAAGVRQVDLCDQFGLSMTAMHCIVHRKTWRHVD